MPRPRRSAPASGAAGALRLAVSHA